jgi:hypothetical protein
MTTTKTEAWTLLRQEIQLYIAEDNKVADGSWTLLYIVEDNKDGDRSMDSVRRREQIIYTLT